MGFRKCLFSFLILICNTSCTDNSPKLNPIPVLKVSNDPENLIRSVASQRASSTNVTLADLDEIIVSAGSLKEFLENKSLQKKYFQALQDYYGPQKKIGSEAYDRIISDLAAHLPEIEGLEARLWETTSLGEPLQVTYTSAYPHFTVGMEWVNYHRELLSNLRAQAGDFFNDGKLNSKRVRKYSAAIEKKIAEHSQKVQGLTRKKRKEADAQFFIQLEQSSWVQSLSAASALEYLQRKDVKNRLASPSVDIVVRTMDEVRNQARLSIQNLASKRVLKRIQSAIKRRLPDTESLTREKYLRKTYEELVSEYGESIVMEDFKEKLTAPLLFPVNSNYDMKIFSSFLFSKKGTLKVNLSPIPRRIHGVFKGLFDSECIAGSCVWADYTSIERYATSALKETRLWNVEINGIPKGFVQVVPIKVGEHIYGAIEFGSAMLSGISEGSEKQGREFLFDLVADKIRIQMKDDVRGLVANGASECTNSGTLNLVINRANSFKCGLKVSGLPAKHLDSLAYKIIKRPKVRNIVDEDFDYDGAMVFEGSSKGTLETKKYRVLLDARQRSANLDKIRKYIEGSLSINESEIMGLGFENELINLSVDQRSRLVDRLQSDKIVIPGVSKLISGEKFFLSVRQNINKNLWENIELPTLIYYIQEGKYRLEALKVFISSSKCFLSNEICKKIFKKVITSTDERSIVKYYFKFVIENPEIFNEDLFQLTMDIFRDADLDIFTPKKREMFFDFFKKGRITKERRMENIISWARVLHDRLAKDSKLGKDEAFLSQLRFLKVHSEDIGFSQWRDFERDFSLLGIDFDKLEIIFQSLTGSISPKPARKGNRKSRIHRTLKSLRAKLAPLMLCIKKK